MPLPRVVIQGRLATEPELRFLPSGAAVTNFRVAASQPKKNEQTNQWEDDKQCFLSVSVWRDMAENVASSLHQGDPVIIEGRLYERSYERDGQTVRAFQVDADTVGPDLRWSEARVQRTQRQNGQSRAQQGQGDQWTTPPANAPQRPAQPAQQPQQGNWQQQNQQGWGNQPNYDDPPF